MAGSTALGRRATALPSPVLAALVAAALFAPTLAAGYLESWDDTLIILGRPELHSFGRESLATILRPGSFEEYLPLRDLSYLLELAVPADRATVSHALNVALMALATLGVGMLARAAGAGPAAAGWAALWFAVHPVHVEAVAPVASRKELLSAVLTIAALLTWFRARQRPAAAARIGALLLFTLAMLSKTTAVPLALVIGAVAFATPAAKPGLPSDGAAQRSLGARLGEGAREALPYLMIGGSLIAVTVRIRALYQIDVPYQAFGLVERLLLLPRIVLTYARVLVWPGAFHVGYPLAMPALSDPRVGLDVLLLCALACVAVVTARRDRVIAFGWIWFAAFLLPVVNLMPQPIFAADRYLTIASVGAAILVGRALELAFARLQRRGVAPARTALAAACAMVALLAGWTVLRERAWRDDVPFWSAQVATDPASWQAREGLAWAFAGEGRTAEAAAAMRAAIDRFGRFDAPFRGSEVRLAKLWVAVARFDEELGGFARAAEAFGRAHDALPPERAEDRARLERARAAAHARATAAGSDDAPRATDRPPP